MFLYLPEARDGNAVTFTRGGDTYGGTLAIEGDHDNTLTMKPPQSAAFADGHNADDANGVTAAGAISGSPAFPGQAVTVTVRFTGTSARAGTHTISLNSGTGTAFTPEYEDIPVATGAGLGDDITFTFPMPAAGVGDLALTHIFVEAITSGEITVTAPERGALVADSVPSLDNTSAGEVTWTPAVGTNFGANTVYTAVFTLTANTGFSFNGLAEDALTVNVLDATVTHPAGGTENTVEVTIVFPVTEATPAWTVTAEAYTDMPVAGANNQITLTVLDCAGEIDTTFDGVVGVWISNVAEPLIPQDEGARGWFNGIMLTDEDDNEAAVTFTEGVATADLQLFSSASQNIAFGVDYVMNPDTFVTITPTHETTAETAVLTVTEQPAVPAANGAALATQPQISVTDRFGNPFGAGVSITAAASGAEWTLGGTTTAATGVSGVAAFDDLTAGTTNPSETPGATITFTKTGATPVTSEAFTVPGASAIPGISANPE